MSYVISLNGSDYSLTKIMESAPQLKRIEITKAQEELLLDIFGLSTTRSFTWGKFVELWNQYATRNQWPKLLIKNKLVQDKFLVARKSFPNQEDWILILDELERDPFFSGKKSSYKTKPMTLFYDRRFFTLHEVALARKEEGASDPDEFLNQLDSILGYK